MIMLMSDDEMVVVYGCAWHMQCDGVGRQRMCVCVCVCVRYCSGGNAKWTKMKMQCIGTGEYSRICVVLCTWLLLLCSIGHVFPLLLLLLGWFVEGVAREELRVYFLSFFLILCLFFGLQRAHRLVQSQAALPQEGFSSTLTLMIR